jgi:acetyl esterase/lipase
MFRWTYLCVVLSAVLATAQETNPQQARLQQLLQRYPEADANKDGKLTAEEVQAYRQKLQAAGNRGERRARIQPTYANVSYGSHERNVLDLWLPKASSDSDGPLPVFVYFHGGGFVAGDKSGFDPAPYLSAGMAVVSGNYRFVDGKDTLSPAPLQDAARAIQFLKYRADEWNLDASRIAVSGSSAGAVISLWIGYHDDLADASSDDPVARQSSRVKCIVPLNGPTNLDPRWITGNMGGPKHIHGSFPKMFGAAVSDSDGLQVRERILESSPIEHLTDDDVPTLLIYSGKNEGIPLPESASSGVLIHHPFFGVKLKEKLDSLKIANEFHAATDARRDRSKLIVDWLQVHLMAVSAE